MSIYTTQPSTHWQDYIDILEDGQICMSVPAGQEQRAIGNIKRSRHNHWSAIAARADDRLVVADSTAYSIGSADDYPKGFGGTRWSIRFHDGRVVVTDSLWHMGKVPPEWREQLPDNAMLLELR